MSDITKSAAAATPPSKKQQSEGNSAPIDKTNQALKNGRAMIDSFHSLMRSLTAINRVNAVKSDVDNVITPTLFQSKKAKMYQSTMRHLVHRDRPLTDIELLKLTRDNDDGDGEISVSKPLLRLRKQQSSSTAATDTRKQPSDPLSSEATPRLLGWPLLRRRKPSQTSSEDGGRSGRSVPARHNLPRMEFLCVGGFEPENPNRNLSQSPTVTENGFRLLRLPKKRSMVDRKHKPAPDPEFAGDVHYQPIRMDKRRDAQPDTGRGRSQHAPAETDKGTDREHHVSANPNIGRDQLHHEAADLERGRALLRHAPAGANGGGDRVHHEPANPDTGHGRSSHASADLDRGRVLLRYAPADASTQTSTNASSQTEVPADATKPGQVIHITSTAVQTSGSLTADQRPRHFICTNDQQVQTSGNYSQPQQSTPEKFPQPQQQHQAPMSTTDTNAVENGSTTTATPTNVHAPAESVSSDSVSSIDDIDIAHVPNHGVRMVTTPSSNAATPTSNTDTDPTRKADTNRTTIVAEDAVADNNNNNTDGDPVNNTPITHGGAFVPVSARMRRLQSQLDKLSAHADNLEEEMGDHHQRMHVVSEAHQSHILQWHKALHDADTENARIENTRSLHRSLVAKAYGSPSNHPAAQRHEDSISPPHWSHAAEEFGREQKKVLPTAICHPN